MTRLSCRVAVAFVVTLGCVAMTGLMVEARVASAAGKTLRPVHTYSIVARDSVTGELGVAVQSHWFSVGSRVIWAQPGVGAIATQSFTEVSYGPLGLDLMRAGKSAAQALAALITADPQESVRQVAMVDARGNVAVHTGSDCIAAAGNHRGKQYSVQANLMEKNTVWDAMARAYETSEGDLAERLLRALEAAQGEGGDIRGKQSAAIVIVGGERTGRPWERLVDLRVEDHPEPVKELRRLIDVHRAYEKMDAGDEYLAVGDVAGAVAAYSAAADMMPNNPEIKFWAAITMMSEGNEKEALAFFRDVFAAEPKWVEVVRRLPASGLLDEELVEKILAARRD